MTFRRAYEGIPSEVRHVRAELADAVEGCPVADELVLIASELATNAVVHSRSGELNGTFTIRAEIREADARVEVEDQGGDWVPREDDDEYGRGLAIIASLAGDSNWGVENGDAPDSRVVWARLSWHQDRGQEGKARWFPRPRPVALAAGARGVGAVRSWAVDAPEKSTELAADTLRAWALDEDLKRRVMSTPALAELAIAVARRYSGGETVDDAIAAARAGLARGHQASIDYAGESVRDAGLARRETDVFLTLAAAIGRAGIPSTVSFDLSHVGSVVDRELGFRHAREIAAATAPLGTALMISAEGSDRTDLVLDLHEALATEFPHVGVTLQARLHRSRDDLEQVLARPGTVRLAKGSFLETDAVAWRRGSPELSEAYLALAGRLVTARHSVSFATHDEALVNALIDAHGDDLREPWAEFEMLMGLGSDLLDRLHREGYRTREYVIFGGGWWLYVLNRIAEQPERVLTALADINHLFVRPA